MRIRTIKHAAAVFLFDWTGVSPIGTFDDIVSHPGTAWDVSRLYGTGAVTLTSAVPEPTAVVISLFVCGSFVSRRHW